MKCHFVGWGLAIAIAPAVLRAQDAVPAAPSTPTPPSAESEADTLRRAAEAEADVPSSAAGQSSGQAAPGQSSGQAAVPASRDLNRYNPEISASADMLVQYLGQSPHVNEEARTGFTFRELEIDIRSNLDPFSQFRAQLSAGNEGVGVEEAYILWTGLLSHTTLTAGRMRQTLSPLNRWHSHALDQFDQPLAIRGMIGEEGLLQSGMRAEVLIPGFGDSAHTLDLEVTDSENETLFAGDQYALPSALAHLGNVFPLGDAGYLELGLTGLHGYHSQATPAGHEPRAATDLLSADLSVAYDPVGGADRFRLFFRSQGLYVDRDDKALKTHVKQVGGYAYVNAHLDAQFEVGLRGDYLSGTGDSLSAATDSKTVEISPYITFWESEFFRLRLQYRHDTVDGGPNADLVTLQLDGAVGPHSHDKY